MNTVTFVLPWLPILVGLGVLAVPAAFFSAWKVFRSRKKKKSDAKERKKAETKQRNISKFDHPWDLAYKTCWDASTWDASQAFLKLWLKDQDTDNLPRLSTQQVELLLESVASKVTIHYTDYLELLTPYLDTHSDHVATKAAEKKEYEESQKLFRYPWDKAYEVCWNANSYDTSRLWFEKWIVEQNDLPPITLEAAEILMDELADSTKDPVPFAKFMGYLAPHLDTGHYSPKVFDYQLKEQLPEPWYNFWMEIKEYPDRYSLFYEKICRIFAPKEELHLVTKIPLTTEQATLLARALGNGEDELVKKYAYDLRKIVTMKTERRCLD